MAISPIVLRGDHTMLEPLTLEHHAELCAVALDPELWLWTTTSIATPDDLREYIREALIARDAGTAIPFVIRNIQSGRAVGSSRFGNIDHVNRRAEIGWTWVAQPWQRSPINTEAKYLLLTHAFESAGCIRVELKTDALNIRSRQAIARVGAVEEGTLRSHMITQSGRIRDTVYFSILAEEWPAVKAALAARLQRGSPPGPVS